MTMKSKPIYRIALAAAFMLSTTLASAQSLMDKGGTLTVLYENPFTGPTQKFNLLDGDVATKYYTQPHSSSGIPNPMFPLWIQWECDQNERAVYFMLGSANDVPNRDPKDWRLEGSENGTDWTTLHEVADAPPFAERLSTYYFLIENPGSYKFYRLWVEQNNGDAGFQLSEFHLFDAYPTLLKSAVGVNGSQVLVSWQDLPEGTATVEIQRSGDGETFETIGSLDPQKDYIYQDESVRPGETYHYRLRALGAYGEMQSNTTVTTTPATEGGLSNFIPAFDGELSISRESSVAAQQSSNLIDGEYGTKYFLKDFAASELWIVYSFDEPQSISAYALVAGNDVAERDPKAWTLEGSNDNSTWDMLDEWTIISQFPERNGRRVFPVNSANSYQHYRITFTENHGNVDFQLSEWELLGVHPDAPGFPQDFHAENTGPNYVELAWGAPSNAGAGVSYQLERSADAETYTLVSETSETTFLDEGLEILAQYRYRIRAVADNELMSAWHYLDIETAYDPTLPLPASGLQATPTGETTIELTWVDESDNEDGFEIERSLNGSTFEVIDEVGPDETTYTNTDLHKATEYSYRIRPYNSEGHALVYSEIVTVVTDGQNTPPTMNAIGNMVSCMRGQPITFTVSGISAGSGTNEDWQQIAATIEEINSEQLAEISVGGVEDGKLTFSVTAGEEASGDIEIQVTLTDDGGTTNDGEDFATQSFVLTISPLPIAIISEAGQDIPRGAPVTLTADVTGSSTDYSYEWEGSNILSGQHTNEITIQPTMNGIYRVTITSNDGCTNTAEMAIRLQGGYQVALNVNNVLTPNGDGINDHWVIYNIDKHPSNSVRVFDHTGKVVFQQTSYQNDWDGTYKGSPLPEGAYPFVIDFADGYPHPVKGVLTIIHDLK